MSREFISLETTTMLALMLNVQNQRGQPIPPPLPCIQGLHQGTASLKRTNTANVMPTSGVSVARCLPTVANMLRYVGHYGTEVVAGGSLWHGCCCGSHGEQICRRWVVHCIKLWIFVNFSSPSHLELVYSFEHHSHYVEPGPPTPPLHSHWGRVDTYPGGTL